MSQDGGDDGQSATRSWRAALTDEIVRTLPPVLITVGSFIGFVALAGGAIVWVRFEAAGIPPDQAVDAMPQGELAAIGTVSIGLFALLGALAVVGVYLIDRGGRPTPGMSRGLVILALTEAAAVFWLVEEAVWQRVFTAGGIFLILTILAVLVTRTPGFTHLSATLAARNNETDPESPPEDGRVKLPKMTILAGAVIWGGLLLVARTFDFSAPWAEPMTFVLLMLIVLVGTLSVRRIKDGEAHEDHEDRQAHQTPLRFGLTTAGETALAGLAVLAVAVPGLVLWQWWPVAALATAVVLGLALWRVATLNGERFLWYGIAVFFSVPLFGTITSIAMNLDEPRMQPIALLVRTESAADKALQGLYVTETSDRVYFASIATDGCSKQISPHSGRLMWVPRSEVVAMSVGPLQAVGKAGDTAVQMAAALSPATEDRGLRAGADESPVAKRHLEDAGHAVRRDFGGGLSLDPPSVEPGGTATLRMAVINEQTEGFGDRPEGKHVRVGGVAVPPDAIRDWQPDEIEFIVPRDAKTGPVTVSCARVADLPQLRVRAKID